MSESVKRILFSIFAGIFAGLLMAILLLVLMIANGFAVNNVQFVCIAIIAFALPMCVNFLERRGFSVLLCQIVMIVLSFLITLLYGNYTGMASNLAGKYSSYFSSVFRASLILHLFSAAGAVVSAIGRKISKKHAS